MRFVWDTKKDLQNQRKHGIPFEIATDVFEDPFVMMFLDSIIDGEERFWAVGSLRKHDIIAVVVHAVNGGDFDSDKDNEIVRIISARKATSHERRLYEEAHE